MKNKTLLLAFLILSFSCKKKEAQCTWICHNQDFGISISTDFSSEDVDTVIVKRFDKNTGFSKLHNITIFYGDLSGRFEPRYDYIVQMASVSKTFSITEIQDEGKLTVDEPCYKNGGCTNSIVSHKINGQVFPGFMAFLK